MEMTTGEKREAHNTRARNVSNDNLQPIFEMSFKSLKDMTLVDLVAEKEISKYEFDSEKDFRTCEVCFEDVNDENI